MAVAPALEYVATSSRPRASAPSRRHTTRTYLIGLVVTDFVAIALAALIAIYARSIDTFFPEAEDVAGLVLPLANGLIAAWLLVIALFGGYSARHLGVGMVEYRRVMKASFSVAALLGVYAYLTQYPLSRGFFVFFFVIGSLALLLGRFSLRRVIHRARSRGHLMTQVLVAGDLDHLSEVASVLKRESWLGYEVMGALCNDCTAEVTPSGVHILGTPDDAVHVLNTTGAQAIIFAEGSFRRGRDFNEFARTLEASSAQMIVVPALTDVSSQRMDIRPVAGIPLVHIERPRALEAARWRKRLFDILGSVALLLIGTPIMLAVALAVKFGDGGPIFFKQVRAGRKGEPFEFFKFRSMVVDAEARLASLMHRNESDGVLFKMTSDPRITPIGRFIRRYSLDELPQLVNVLFGDMSLVGPRPALMREVDQYQDHVLRRLDVRPGMTGLWQVSGRSELSWEDTVRLDLYYVDNWSMLQDLAILMKTLGAVVGKHGAY